MSDDEVPTLVPAGGQEKSQKPLGMRKNGKQWHEQKKAFRPTKGLTTFEKRAKERAAMAQMKAKEKEMKDEKEQARKEKIEKIRENRAKKEERERYEKMAETMHRKRVERLKRKEKRNKLINS
ncbi:cgr1 family domain-containing protein [Pochonia chlamydosporia 170]|uniref:rRNA-processing protein n=1 Tax=Pochonia chlamydosporia 170 TaxID=1380566 RepID=A0A179FZJ8_METCM|nr:cgr1 family domain-containing protein [Pochonia chlamydosporia 170]OAQ70610.1 cgr1 family domain-containing protein [Pochonia chlamydosporia 170]